MKPSKAQLLERKRELTRRMDAIRADLGGGLAKDSEEQAMQLENMEVLQEIYRVAGVELQQLDRQLAAADDAD